MTTPRFKTASERYSYEAATLAVHKIATLEAKAEWTEYRDWLRAKKIGTPAAVDKKTGQRALGEVWGMSEVTTTPRERLEAFL